MSQNISRYRGIVLSKYKSISDFARAIGWSKNKAWRVVNGVQEPDSEDMTDLIRVLEIASPEEFIKIFFPELSTKWTSGATVVADKQE